MWVYSHKFPYTEWACTIKYKNGRCAVQTKCQVHPVLFITKRGYNIQKYTLTTWMSLSVQNDQTNLSSQKLVTLLAVFYMEP